MIPEKNEKEEIKLASLFKTKYPLKNDEPKFVDKVVETDGEIEDIKDNKNKIKVLTKSRKRYKIVMDTRESKYKYFNRNRRKNAYRKRW